MKYQGAIRKTLESQDGDADASLLVSLPAEWHGSYRLELEQNFEHMPHSDVYSHNDVRLNKRGLQFGVVAGRDYKKGDPSEF